MLIIGFTKNLFGNYINLWYTIYVILHSRAFLLLAYPHIIDR